MKDYEKKYKEALSRAATELETCGADKSLRNMIYAIFPDELKESEDEKIRKALVRFHKSTIDIDGIKGADIVAWLEKQGEQKPTEWSKEDENRFQNIIACIEDCYNEKDAQDLIRWFKYLRHQPKPVWSKADIKMLELIIDGYQNTEDFSKVDGVFVDWLKSLKDRMEGKED